MCGNNLVLYKGVLKNNDISVRQLDNGMLMIKDLRSGDEREVFTLVQVEEIVNLHAAAVDWVFRATNNSIITDADLEKGYFVDTYYNCQININSFWNMVSFAKQHNLAKHSFPF